MEEPRENAYPLTALQQGMVYHSLLAPQSGVYVQQLVGHLREKLNVSAFREAWHRLVARHPVLRTRLRVDGPAEFLQEVEPGAAPEWTEDDWSRLSAHDQERQWQSYLREDRRRGFDFSRSPLMRLALLRLADEHYLFCWTFHHVLLDGRSNLIVLKELFAFYEALCQGKEPPAEHPPPYHDFVHWLGKQDFSRAKGFWQEMLRGFVAPTPLIVDSTPGHPDRPEDDHAVCEARLTQTASESLRAFAAEHGLTVGTLLQGAWAALLSRYSGDEDVAFGATRACRHSSVQGAESMVGFLINTVPLRVRVASDMPVVPWLKSVRSQWVAMRPYEHTPLGDIQAWSEFGPRRPLFESVLIFEGHSLNEALQAQGGNWTRREFQLLEKGSYPLAALGYGGSRLLMRLAYDRTRFDGAAAARMLGHWRTLLLGLPTSQERRVADLPLLTDAERRTLLVEWNDTRREYSKHMCLHQLVEAQAARTPDHVAVLFEDERLTYDQLNTRSNRLAHYLRGAGVGPEALVAICLGRTPALIVGVLAVLKAGGAYVPLDPADPEERLSSMLAESGASVLLTQKDLLARLPEHNLRTVCLESDGEAIARQSGTNPQGGARPENLAYAIYTSGSTGRPKLIGVEHGSAVNVVFFTTHGALSPKDLAVVAFADPICFDPSVYRMFCPLSVGGSIVVLDSVFALAHCRHADSVTWLGSAPSPLKALLRDFVLPESVRVVSMGAEVASEELLGQLAAYPQLDKVVNLYGPTETTVYCTHAVLMERTKGPGEPERTSGLRRAAEASNIGRPIWNVQVYILDARLRPVPVGVTGEIHVGGDCLARGYLNQPELTAERFIANPFSSERGARLYRTGDLGRYLPDGSMEFLGRSDDQVKIRGIRTEPQGIEAVLNQHPAVRESVVRVVAAPSGEKHLVAYVACASRDEAYAPGSGPATVGGLRGYLEQKLPRHMVPLTFVLLDELPRDSRGKLDPRALPEPALGPGGPKHPHVPPRTHVERVLAQIWGEVLGVGEIGVHDDLIELGCDSMSATRIVNRLIHAFGTKLPLRTIFDAPTIAGLAGIISQGMKVE